MLRTPDGHGPATRADTVVLQGVMTQLLRSRTR
jgi:hypothetical protein